MSNLRIYFVLTFYHTSIQEMPFMTRILQVEDKSFFAHQLVHDMFASFSYRLKLFTKNAIVIFSGVLNLSCLVNKEWTMYFCEQ